MEFFIYVQTYFQFKFRRTKFSSPYRSVLFVKKMAEAVVEGSSENEPADHYEEMLDFERQIFMDVIEKDCLVISAKYNLKNINSHS